MALLGIFLLPCFNKSVYQDILLALTGLAVGTLFSDAILHLLPVVCDPTYQICPLSYHWGLVCVYCYYNYNFKLDLWNGTRAWW